MPWGRLKQLLDPAEWIELRLCRARGGCGKQEGQHSERGRRHGAQYKVRQPPALYPTIVRHRSILSRLPFGCTDQLCNAAAYFGRLLTVPPNRLSLGASARLLKAGYGCANNLLRN
jgi:hypothetical protein